MKIMDIIKKEDYTKNGNISCTAILKYDLFSIITDNTKRKIIEKSGYEYVETYYDYTKLAYIMFKSDYEKIDFPKIMKEQQEQRQKKEEKINEKKDELYKKIYAKYGKKFNHYGFTIKFLKECLENEKQFYYLTTPRLIIDGLMKEHDFNNFFYNTKIIPDTIKEDICKQRIKFSLDYMTLKQIEISLRELEKSLISEENKTIKDYIEKKLKEKYIILSLN